MTLKSILKKQSRLENFIKSEFPDTNNTGKPIDKLTASIPY